VHSTLFFKLNLWAFYISSQKCDNGRHVVDAMEQVQTFLIPLHHLNSKLQIICSVAIMQ
jgi:hypothetical protein